MNSQKKDLLVVLSKEYSSNNLFIKKIISCISKRIQLKQSIHKKKKKDLSIVSIKNTVKTMNLPLV